MIFGARAHFYFPTLFMKGTGLVEWESFTQSQQQGIAQSRLLKIRNLERFEYTEKYNKMNDLK
jgi:DNA gyrase/topoisomerase IV subunit A